MSGSERQPLVSVLMITYNHGKYIRQALESVLAQVTNFDFEVVIGDDASIDKTAEICNEYSATYPAKINLIHRKKNIGAKSNFIDTLFKCNGKYIAFCEGDDYWDTSDKLQKQYDFLERNPEYVMVGGYAKTIIESENYAKVNDVSPNLGDFDVSTDYLFGNNPFSTVTVFFKNYIIKSFPEVYFQGTGGDRRLYLLLSQHGKCRYIDQPFGVYRVHSKGLSARVRNPKNHAREVYIERIHMTLVWNKYFGYRYTMKSIKIIAVYSWRLLRNYIRQEIEFKANG